MTDSRIHGLGILTPLGAVPPVQVCPICCCPQALPAPVLPAWHGPWWPRSGLRQCLALCCCNVSHLRDRSPCQPCSALGAAVTLCPPHALTYNYSGRGSWLQLCAQRKDTHKQNTGGLHGAPEDADGWRRSAGVYIHMRVGRGHHTHNLWVLKLLLHFKAVPEAAAALCDVIN